MWATLVSMYKTEGGVSALYRGIVPTVAGVAPYVCLTGVTQHSRICEDADIYRLVSTLWYMSQSARHLRLKATRTLVPFASFWRVPSLARLLKPARIHCK